MYNFFADENSRQGSCFYIKGADFNHIKNALRFKIGERFLVSEGGESHLCSLMRFEDDYLIAQIIKESYSSTELPIKTYLFQGLPKSDKMELIIQKCVELGVYEIVPVEMNRCIVKLDEKKKKSKKERWQAISESAAKQSKRNIIPTVSQAVTFKESLNIAKNLDLILVPYENENGISSTRAALNIIKSGMSVGIFIGPEGGFDGNEIEALKQEGAKSISLGKRILRTETAAISAASMCMLYAEMNLDND